MMKSMYMLLTIHSKQGVNLLEGAKRGRGLTERMKLQVPFYHVFSHKDIFQNITSASLII